MTLVHDLVTLPELGLRLLDSAEKASRSEYINELSILLSTAEFGGLRISGAGSVDWRVGGH
jgi:hypothetical protein